MLTYAFMEKVNTIFIFGIFIGWMTFNLTDLILDIIIYLKSKEKRKQDKRRRDFQSK